MEVFHPAGRQTHYTAVKAASKDLEQLIAADEELVVDMSGIAKIDVADLGAITQLLKRQRENGGGLRLINLKGQPLEMLSGLKCAHLLMTREKSELVYPRALTAAFRSFITTVRASRPGRPR